MKMIKSLFLLFALSFTLAVAAQEKPSTSTINTKLGSDGRLGNTVSSGTYPTLDYNGPIDDKLEENRIVTLGDVPVLLAFTEAGNTPNSNDSYAVIADSYSISVVYIDSLHRRIHLRDFFFTDKAQFLILDDSYSFKAGYTYTSNTTRKVDYVWQTPKLYATEKPVNIDKAFLRLNKDGDFVLYSGTNTGSGDGEKLWSTETCENCTYGIGNMRAAGGNIIK